MPTIAWLMLGAGAWLAAVGAICALLTVAKRADAHLQPPARAIADPTDIAAAGPRPSGLAGPLGPRASAIVVAEPPPARPVIASAASAAALTAIAARSAHDTTPHTPNYVLHRGARAIGSLQWRARSREAPGWYLRRGARPARRLALDIGLDGFADRSPANRQAWQQCAHAAATLSTPLALDAADRALRGGLPAPPPSPLEPGTYELHITGLDPVTVALACPSMRVTGAGDTSVITGVFDSDAMHTVIRRLNLLGARVLAIFHHYGAPPAAPEQRTRPPPSARRRERNGGLRGRHNGGSLNAR